MLAPGASVRPYDRDYVARRWQVGKRHVEIGLEHVYANSAMARLRAGLLATLDRFWRGERGSLVQVILSLNRLLDLELAIVEAAYRSEYVAQLRRNEQLTTVGQVAASVGHELREPLNVLKTSLYFLRNARMHDPNKIAEHEQRIDRHFEATELILKEISEFAALAPPKVCSFSFEKCVDDALQQEPLGDRMRLTRDFPPSLPPAVAEKDHICKAFGRLIRRAKRVVGPDGELSIFGRDALDRLEVIFVDGGPQLCQDILTALREPLSWRTVRTLGMGLAVAKAMLEWNAATLEAANELERGCKLIVRLSKSA